jgi:hypothetical protein
VLAHDGLGFAKGCFPAKRVEVPQRRKLDAPDTIRQERRMIFSHHRDLLPPAARATLSTTGL